MAITKTNSNMISDLDAGSTYASAADVATNTTKLAGIAAGATANDTDSNLKNRANHTGTQLASTISDFDTEVSNNTSVAANTAKVGLTDNSITAARISDTDDQFLVDDTSTQKKMQQLQVLLC